MNEKDKKKFYSKDFLKKFNNQIIFNIKFNKQTPLNKIHIPLIPSPHHWIWTPWLNFEEEINRMENIEQAKETK